MDKKIDEIYKTHYIHWLPGGNQLITANDNGSVWLWDIDEKKETLTGKLDKKIDSDITKQGEKYNKFSGPQPVIDYIALSYLVTV